ncbi:MAG: multicopper oxidase [Thermoplasmata archaeon]|jgi:FtsP/CotA-like multicopper oxidase with cupredoxin domain|nr:multicopper oxidase [Thermoplasmata archaeon]
MVPPAPAATLDPLTIPKWVNQLEGPPPVFDPTVFTDESGGLSHEYQISMMAGVQQVLPASLPMTPVWGYEGPAKDSVTGEYLGTVFSSPGPSFEAIRGIPATVEWKNEISSPHMFPVDPTLHWADPTGMGMPMPPYPTYPPGFDWAQSPVPLVTHLHGAEVRSDSDGGPDSWFTYDGLYGPAYEETPEVPGTVTFTYPNAQPATTLWYHDHALGITRINVMSGLAGFYLLRDPADPIAQYLPSGKYDMPVVIQDRTFNVDGTMFFDSVGLNPDDHPYWTPEFFGNTIMVNGKVWPNMDVDQGLYRLRLLDGSNARFYTLTFWDKENNVKLPFYQIASDGGYLKSPALLRELTIAPGERAEVLVDFSGLAPGTKILLSNSAKSPFPMGGRADPRTVGQVMQFTVVGSPGDTLPPLPSTLNPDLAVFPSITGPVDKVRYLTLTEVMGPGGPLEILLNGQKWHGEISELPVLGSTEMWVITNPTADTHPIHLHLVQFQLMYRQKVDDAKYYNDWLELNSEGTMGGMIPFMHDYIPIELPVGPYLKNKPMTAPPNEQGWKDTVRMNPGETTFIIVRFAPIDGSVEYPFDATYGPGYVWHCHILDHEDNEMMRPYLVVAPEE